MHWSRWCLTAGYLLASIGAKTDHNVTWIPSYGSEMRGGTANCSVKISDQPVATPCIEKCDVLIVMNGPSVDKFEPVVRKGRCMFVDSSIVKGRAYRDDVRVFEVPADELAQKCGNPRGANLPFMASSVREADA